MNAAVYARVSTDEQAREGQSLVEQQRLALERALQDEFERAYAERSGVTVERLRALGRVVVRCWCGAPECEGWASVSTEAARDYEPGGIYHVVQTQLGAHAEAMAEKYEAKAGQARISFVRRWYKRRAVKAREIARSEEDPGAR